MYLQVAPKLDSSRQSVLERQTQQLILSTPRFDTATVLTYCTHCHTSSTPLSKAFSFIILCRALFNRAISSVSSDPVIRITYKRS